MKRLFRIHVITDRRERLDGACLVLFGWKIAAGFWGGKPRYFRLTTRSEHHQRVRHWPLWGPWSVCWKDYTPQPDGFILDFSRISVGIQRVTA